MTVVGRASQPSIAPIGPAGRRPACPAERRAGGGRTSARDQDLHAMAASFAALFLEVESGRRPGRQLAVMMSEPLWRRLAPVWVRGGGDRGQGTARVLAVHGARRLGLLGEALYDAVVVLRRGTRVGALCLRLTHTGKRWLVAEAARPEDGRLRDQPTDSSLQAHPLFAMIDGGW